MVELCFPSNYSTCFEKYILFSKHFSCLKVWLIAIMNRYLVYDIECSFMFSIRCEMLPEKFCEGVPLNYDTYAIDIANRPQLINLANMLRELYKQSHDLPDCGLILGLSVCLAEFPRCNANANRLQVICESGCERYNELFSDCLAALVSERRNLTQFGKADASFNCSNPGSYLPNVSASLYDEQSCYDLFGSQGKFACK